VRDAGEAATFKVCSLICFFFVIRRYDTKVVFFFPTDFVSGLLPILFSSLYCSFGGTGIVQLVFSGNEEAKAVVSFHGGLTTLPTAETNVTPYTLM
jgi:hypothetical protein